MLKNGFLVLNILFLGCNSAVNPIIAPTPYRFDIPYTLNQLLPPMVIPADNPMTIEGIALGKKLFFDSILSKNNKQSCASCHLPSASFSDQSAFSKGIDGRIGSRNTMPLVNIGYSKSLFWDGRSPSLEIQAFEPVTNPVEMHELWSSVINKLSAHPSYPTLFKMAFGNQLIDSVLVTKAIAQFERTLLSANAPFDKYIAGNNHGWSEADFKMVLKGFSIFMSEDKGDCFHCHGDKFNPLWTDNLFHNNGLDEIITDKGLGDVTHQPFDEGKFKTPTLRNLLFTAPYMHDGRFNSIEEVIDHYSEGLKNSPTIDPLMKQLDKGGVQLNKEDKTALLMFLKSLSDSSFVSNTN